MRGPALYTIEEIVNCLPFFATLRINGYWVLRRNDNMCLFKTRVKRAWMVFTGKADVLVWPEGQ
jgi:hypothetical protein